MKNNNLEKFYNSNYRQINQDYVTLYDCFLYHQKTELFTGENKNYCNICKQLFDLYYTSKIYIIPNILVKIFNRGKGNIFDIKLDFMKF